MAFTRNLFGKKRQAEPSNSTDIQALTPEQIQKIVELAETLVGGWPDELSRDIFGKLDFDRLLIRLKWYQERVHPGLPSGKEIKPEYPIVNGGIARASYAPEDLKLVMTAQMLNGGNGGAGNLNGIEAMGQLAFRVIEYYSEKRLAKFLFLLPRARDAETLSKGGKATLIVENLLIDVYKGIENTLFEVYDELPEGKKFDDTMVIQKLLSIIEWAQT